MKRPTPASLKKVTPENLARLGVERLAELLADVADARPELKRRLRMELAAEQGPEHLAAEIDRRLGSLEGSRSKVSWRQRPTFVRDLDALRLLIANRLAGLDKAAARERMWLFMDLARRIGPRVRDKEGAVAATFERAAADVGRLLQGEDEAHVAEGLVAAMVRYPVGWAEWLPAVLHDASPGLADAALRAISRRGDAQAGWMPLIRLLAEAAGNADAYRSTYTEAALKTPSVAAEVAQRLLAAGRIAEAGRVLETAAQPTRPARRFGIGAKGSPPDPEWEDAWIEYLEKAGRTDEAQVARWESFERTLSVERARDFTRRLADFDDVEAEGRAFAHAAAHANFRAGLRFLMDWPALPEAAQMIQARADEVDVSDDEAHLWAAKLRRRHPAAAHTLLRKAAAAAFRKRDFATCDRLTAEADSIPLDA